MKKITPMTTSEMTALLTGIAEGFDQMDNETAGDICMEAVKEIKRLQCELDEARGRERAAVKDLNYLRKKSGWKCFACEYAEIWHRSICVVCGYNSDNNWQWRGPREEGEAE